MRNTFDAIVVGSGPSGISCAYTLIKRGCRVRLIDAGGLPSKIDPTEFDPFSTNNNRRRWIENDFWRHGNTKTNNSNLKHEDKRQKHFFTDSSEQIIAKIKNARVNTSLSVGGFSNVWGGAVLPISEIDASNWPVSRQMLDPYYRDICEFMTISSETDGLDGLFPINNAVPHKASIRKQAIDFLDHLDANRINLEREGIYFGRSKLAANPNVFSPALEHKPGALFNSTAILVQLLSSTRFSYIGNTFVDKVAIEGQRAELFCRSTIDQSKLSFSCEKLFLAGGAISTTCLLAKSFYPKRKQFYLRTNQNILFPFLRSRRTHGAIKNSFEDYPEVFLELTNLRTYTKFIHFQIYSYGYYVLNPVEHILGKHLSKIIEYLGQPLLERLMVFQCMFHSDYSDKLVLKIDGNCDDGIKANITGIKNPDLTTLSSEMFKLLFAKRKLLGGIPLTSFARHYPPGASFHVGSSFPMSKHPRGLESTILGQLQGLENLHIVDSTILPNLPAPTLTYTVMANSSRIAANA